MFEINNAKINIWDCDHKVINVVAKFDNQNIETIIKLGKGKIYNNSYFRYQMNEYVIYLTF